MRRLAAQDPHVQAARKAVERARAARQGANGITRAYRERVLEDARRRLREAEARALAAPEVKVEPEVRGFCVCGSEVVTINEVLTCAHGHE